MTYNEQEWRRVYTTPGGVGVVDSPRWLLNGCPKCGATTWIVTSDYCAYCGGCNIGYSTTWPFTSRLTALLDEYGTHCPFCRGFGGKCEHCDNYITQPPKAFKEAYINAYHAIRYAKHYGMENVYPKYKIGHFKHTLRFTPTAIKQNAARSYNYGRNK